LQVRRRGHWATLDRSRLSVTGRYVLHERTRGARSLPARVRLSTGQTRRLGRLNVYRYAQASWYGPGLYGNHLGCGGTLTAGRLGVAHKSLPCGSRVTLRHGRRSVRVRVIDRGPYVGGREFDLTAATARRLHFRGHGAILVAR
jgi:rare lipoprotein A (peptidoglycan hydrolase)